MGNKKGFDVSVQSPIREKYGTKVWIINGNVKMAYNSYNRLKLYKKVLEIVNKEFVPGVTTYKGIFHKYVESTYPMSYHTFIKIINTSNIDTKIKTLSEDRQLKMF